MHDAVVRERAWWAAHLDLLATHLGLEAVRALGRSSDDDAAYVLLDAAEALDRLVKARTT